LARPGIVAAAPFSGQTLRVGSFNENVERHSLRRASPERRMKVRLNGFMFEC
jgi:hypothetical protein